MSLFSFFNSNKNSATITPTIQKVRRERKTRQVQVSAIQRLNQGMLRLEFFGEELVDFASDSPDDHVKLLVPSPEGKLVGRDYTPRRFNPTNRHLTIDFAVHDAGPATTWALNAQVGDSLQIVGPKSSSVIGHEVKNWLLIGDETALPAMGRRIEEAEADHTITHIGMVSSLADKQQFMTQATLTSHWVVRPLTQANDATPIISLLDTLSIEANTFVWIAGEARMARSIRTWFINEQKHPKTWLKAGGYWVMGQADAHERMDY